MKSNHSEGIISDMSDICKETGDLLLVIDMQNVYTKGQPWACETIDSAAQAILKLLEAGVCEKVMFTEYLASSQPAGVWADYNRENAAINADPYANEMMPLFTPWLEKYPLYAKSVYSSFSIPEVKAAAQRARRVVITGVVAECCILSTVLAGIDEGCKIIYLKDAVAGLTLRSEEQTLSILDSYAPLHAAIMTVDDYIALTKSGEG